jgi:AcrR family transcriptional regulator
MGRWEPDAAGRLRKAALELYGERGFDQTTVAEIAGRAGLTERTFFRYFADKREVLFGGSELLQAAMVSALLETPESSAPIEQVAAALGAAADFLTDRDYARRRQAVIAAHAELRERELIKLASLSAALGDALRSRAVPEPAASLTAEAGVAVFKIGFERWLADKRKRSLGYQLRESLAALTSSLTVGAQTRR